MNKPLKIVRIGNSAGVVLPKDLLDRLKLDIGDTLSCSQTQDGFLLSVKDPDFEDQMAQARSIMKRYRNALNELAK